MIHVLEIHVKPAQCATDMLVSAFQMFLAKHHFSYEFSSN